MLKSLPNLLTLARFLAVPITVGLMNDGRYDGAFWLFMAAGVTDALDGLLARLLKARTVIGSYLDPLADKALLVAVYVMLGYHDHLPDWLVITVVSRDLLIVGGALVIHLATGRLRMEPLMVSKVNTVAQIVLAALVLADLGHNARLDGVVLINGACALVTLTTLASGLAYVVIWGRRVAGNGEAGR
ncbi:MAG: CDP-alcohol phosphatidyltransferase family protein [Rhodospirillales bacterium]|nr:CDP-alcohol phosphatidyltransferase family protein [Rhodospirillales bacterium]